MSDSIRRKDAIDVIDEYDFEFPDYMERFVMELRDAMKADLKRDIEELPSAQTERKAGRWEYTGVNTYDLSYGGTAYEPTYRCSACRRIFESYVRLDEPIMPEDADCPNFCPNCGARMDGVEPICSEWELKGADNES